MSPPYRPAILDPPPDPLVRRKALGYRAYAAADVWLRRALSTRFSRAVHGPSKELCVLNILWTGSLLLS